MSLCGYPHDASDPASECDDCKLEQRRDDEADRCTSDARDAAAFD